MQLYQCKVQKIVPVTQNQVPIMQPQQASQPNFKQMYMDTTNPLQNANSPPVQMIMEPMAANEAMGGSLFGGSSF